MCDQPPDCLPTQCHLALGTQTSAVFEHSVKTPGDAQTCGQCQRSTLLSRVTSKAEVSSEGNLKQAKTLAETPATYVFCHCSISCGQHNNSGENTHLKSKAERKKVMWILLESHALVTCSVILIWRYWMYLVHSGNGPQN